MHGYAESKRRRTIHRDGYSYPDWKGVVYPSSLKRDVGGPAPELTYLSRYFNTPAVRSPEREALERRA